MIERRIFEAQDIPEIVPAWQALAERAARSPFESPAWLMAWLRHYGSSWQPFVLTWWRAGQLVGVAPLASRSRRIRGIPVRELEFWGRTDTPLSGWVDVVAEDGVRDELLADFAAWLARPSVDWDLFHFLHLAPDALSLAALTSIPRHWRIDLTRVLHSLEYTLALPADASSWQGQLGPKARHEIRRQMRAFERRMDGRIEVLTDPGSAGSLVTALRSHGAERWGEREAYFRRDPIFADFFTDALRGHLEARTGWAVVARDPHGLEACLVMMASRTTAVAVMLGVTSKHEYRALSLGKCLFHEAIGDAAARGCQTFSFLTEGGYKESFWHAAGRPIASGIVTHGAIGWALGAAIGARRVLPAAIGDAIHGRWADRYRP
jgi:CelD/BcsL family acetyltransferase involved in cellulose biosynthesis